MTTGESLLVSEQATAPGNELYKPSDRSELANFMSLGARQGWNPFAHKAKKKRLSGAFIKNGAGKGI